MMKTVTKNENSAPTQTLHIHSWHLSIAILLLFGASLFILNIPTVSSYSKMSVCEEKILELVNMERSHHLSEYIPLIRESGLDLTAQLHCQDMLDRDYFDHVSPDKVTPHNRITSQNRSLLISTTGENIGMRIFHGSGDSAAEIAMEMMKNWMDSPYHRENILSSSFTHIGISIIQCGDKTIAVQHFAGSRGTITPEIPKTVQRGGTFNISIKTDDQNMINPRKFDLVIPGTLKTVCNPTLLRSGHLNSPAGKYRIRLYFQSPGENRWEVYSGLMITVP
ncbi:CAP domain-containing protein [bacterium]|nr:CAP domain-containing protein [bacterium]